MKMSEHTQSLEIFQVVYTDNLFYDIAIRRDSLANYCVQIIDKQ